MYKVHPRYLKLTENNNGLFTQLVLFKSKSGGSEYIQQSKVPMMHFQKSLPRLPIPKLEETGTRYLNSQKPLLSAEDFQKTESFMTSFLKNEGPKLQEELIRKDKQNKHTSYICEPWFDMYLRDRKPLPLNYNPAIVYTQEENERYNDPLVKATNIVVSSMRFLKSLRAGILEPEVFHLNPQKSDTPLFRTVTGLLPSAISWYGAYMFNAYPLDMSQYHNLFNTTRVPCKDKDEIRQDLSGRHLVVLRNGYFYSFDVLDENGHIISARQVASNFRQILNDNRPPNNKSVAVFTSSDRNDWAEYRRRLAEIGSNSALLKEIDSAVFMMVLDDTVIGEDRNGLLRTMLQGQSSNRWFDKSLSFIITKDGFAGVNFEHSWGDGVAVMRYFQDVKKDIGKRPSIQPEEVQKITECPNVRKLEFQVDDDLEGAIKKENARFDGLVQELDVDHSLCEEFGKDNCKKHKISPDALMQLSFQLALYKMEQRSVAVYESCSTAAFKHGRTETIRPCTEQTKNFCSTMTKRTIKDSMTDFKKMLIECSNYHSQLVKEAAMGQGFDRHLFALRKINEQKGGNKIDLFEDPAYANINYNILSTSTLSSPMILLGGFGPVVKDGYGIGYMIHDKSLGLLVTSYKSQRKATEYIKVWESSIMDILRLFK